MNETTLQTQLIDYYQAQLGRYDQLALQIDAAGKAPEGDAIGEVRVLMQEISQHDEASAGIRRQWQQGEYQATPELKAVVDRVKQRLEQLMSKTDASTSAVKDAQSALKPQLRDTRISRRVAEAYSQK